MPNLRGASPVGREEGSRSNAARTGSSGSPRRRRHNLKRVLGPVKTRVERRAIRDELASLQGTRAKGGVRLIVEAQHASQLRTLAERLAEQAGGMYIASAHWRGEGRGQAPRRRGVLVLG